MVGGRRPLLPEILGQPARVGAKSPIVNRYSLVVPQPYDLAKKVQLTVIGSPRRAFQWAQDENRTLPLSPQRGLKNAKRPFCFKIAIGLKKVWYKVPFCENCQRQSCRTFHLPMQKLLMGAKLLIINGSEPFYLKFWVKVTALEQNHRLSIYFC